MKTVQEIEGQRYDDQTDEERESELVHLGLRMIDDDAVDFVRDIFEEVRTRSRFLNTSRATANWSGSARAD